jgi:hypothetical protein
MFRHGEIRAPRSDALKNAGPTVRSSGEGLDAGELLRAVADAGLGRVDRALDRRSGRRRAAVVGQRRAVRASVERRGKPLAFLRWLVGTG